jgi:zinc protease
MKEVQLPPSVQFTTSSGLRVIAAQRGPLPLVSIRLSVRAGSALDPSGKRGISDFTARLLRRGTRSYGAEALNEQIERVGGTLSVGAGEDTLALHLSAPSEQLVPMLKVLASMICEPTFPAKEVRTARERLLAGIANELDDPSSLADRALLSNYWGGHPYGHDPSGTQADVESFTRADVIRFMKARVGPAVSLLSVVGDLDPQALRGQVDRAFKAFRGGPKDAEIVSPLDRKKLGAEVVVVDKPDQTQSQVRLAGPGMARKAPEFMAAKVVETLLGGGFTSRLMEAIRVERGLSYSVGAAFDRHWSDGMFLISTFTKTESTREIIDVALGEVKKLREKGPTADEVATAKKLLIGLYPLRFETNDSLAATFAELKLLELGEDWVARYRSRIDEVSLDALRDVAQRYLFPEPPLVVVVGQAKAVVPQLKGLGKVRVLEPSELG